jgi:hypothetical protein
VIEPGRIDLFVGTSSADVRPVGSVTVVADGKPPQRAFDGWVTLE